MRGALFIFGHTTAKQAFTNSQKLLMDAEQKLDSAKALADAGLENQAKELLAQEREKRAGVDAASLSGQTVVQTEDQTVAQPSDIPYENVSIVGNAQGNAAAPLAPMNGSGIIGEGALGDVVNTYLGQEAGAIIEGAGTNAKSKLVPPTNEIREKFDNEGLTQDKIDGIVSLPKSKKPKPETYLSNKYIEEHKQSFRDSGVVKIMPAEPAGTIGGKGGTFVMTGDQLDNIIQVSRGDIAKI